MASPISQAIKQICEEKNISYQAVLDTIEAALASAYRKDFVDKTENINVKVNFDPETANMRVFDVKTVVEDMELPVEGEAGIEPIVVKEPEPPKGKGKKGAKAKKEEVPAPTPVPAEPGVPVEEEKKFNPKTMIMISEAQKIKRDAAVGEEMRSELSVPGAFGRMAAQTAKQVIMQKLREAEREVVYNEFKDKQGQILIATAGRREGKNILFEMGRATAIMLPDDQAPHERYAPGERLKLYVNQVNVTTKGPEILVSRTNPELVRALFTQEIPEVANGAVEIKNIAREAGSRTKIAVASKEANIDPIGSCIGQRGTRIQTVSGELGGEKIDVILWNEDPRIFIAHALSPAKVAGTELSENDRTAVVRVVGDQLSLAIGKGGQNVRLAAKLTGWKISVVEEKVKGEIEVKAEAAPEPESAPEKSSDESSNTVS